jgi:hypothetical protein
LQTVYSPIDLVNAVARFVKKRVPELRHFLEFVSQDAQIAVRQPRIGPFRGAAHPRAPLFGPKNTDWVSAAQASSANQQLFGRRVPDWPEHPHLALKTKLSGCISLPETVTS